MDNKAVRMRILTLWNFLSHEEREVILSQIPDTLLGISYYKRESFAGLTDEMRGAVQEVYENTLHKYSETVRQEQAEMLKQRIAQNGGNCYSVYIELEGKFYRAAKCNTMLDARHCSEWLTEVKSMIVDFYQNRALERMRESTADGKEFLEISTALEFMDQLDSQ